MGKSNTAKAIKIAMINAEISVAAMAEKLNKPPTTISRWRTRGCDSITGLQQIAKACGITLDELLELGA